MEPIELVALITPIVLEASKKVYEGGLEEGGARIISSILSLIKKKVNRFEQVSQDQKVLQETIYEKLLNDRDFHQELERLYEEYQKYGGRNEQVSQNTDSGVNIKGDNNKGTIVGQQIDKRTFFR